MNMKTENKQMQNISLLTISNMAQRLLLIMLIAASGISSLQAQTSITYYHNDALGSPAAATNEQGDVVWRKTYRPYGSELEGGGQAAQNNRIGYTGHTLDQDTGLVYAGARHYDPEIGRFMSMDPVGFQESNVQSFNKFAYGNNNPYRYRDPTGGIPVETVWDAANVILGAASFMDNMSKSNYGWAAVDALGVIVDVAATVVPYVPGGVSTAIKGSRAIDNSIGAAKGRGALQRMDEAAFEAALRNGPEAVSGFKIHGNKGLVGDSFNRNIFLLESNKRQSIGKLLKSFEAEARAAGAKQLSIMGTSVINPKLVNPKLAERFGFSFQKFSDGSFNLIKALD